MMKCPLKVFCLTFGGHFIEEKYYFSGMKMRNRLIFIYHIFIMFYFVIF